MSVPTQCGVLKEEFDVKWGHNSIRTVGYPSRLNASGRILKQGTRRRGKRSSPQIPTWLEMMKARNENRQKETRIIGGEYASGNC